ncbi:potassium-transporting ATPase subunit C [Streptomyces sp. NPDC002454]
MNRHLRPPAWARPSLTALRVVLALTLLLGLAHPLAMTAAARLPGLRDGAPGGLLTDPDGRVRGSTLLGQSFADEDGEPLPAFFQPAPRPPGRGTTRRPPPPATSVRNPWSTPRPPTGDPVRRAC